MVLICNLEVQGKAKHIVRIEGKLIESHRKRSKDYSDACCKYRRSNDRITPELFN